MSQENALKNNYLYKQPEMEEAFANGLADKIRNDFPKVERAYKISPQEFQEKYVAKGKPVILTGLTDQWATRNLFSLEYFEKHCGNANITIDLYEASLSQNGTISDLVQQITNSAPDKPVYLQEWWFQDTVPDFFKDFGEITHFADDWAQKVLGFINHTLWIGSKGAVTPIHEDTVCFNLCTTQLFGKKEWFLFSKQAWLETNHSEEPDFESFLANAQNQPMSCILEQGDVLYMPHKWWHRTETLEHSASLNSPYITEDIIQPYLRGLFTIPLMIALKGDELRRLNLMRYNVTMERIRKFSGLMNFDPDYIINAIKNDNKKSEHDELKAA